MRKATCWAFAVAASLLAPEPPAAPASAARWKINTHLFAANQALADAIDDGKVTIPPFGAIPVAATALRALRAEPAAYRAGVLAPDLFPDMWTGGWFVHSDLSTSPDRWTADHWIRHVWTRARAWPDPSERNEVMAFAYGFVTHGAGDIFAHTYVNDKADGAWVTFKGPSRTTAVKHVVLEGYVGAHTPATDLSIDVWPRFVAAVMIKDAAARAHSQGAVHFRRWLALRDWLGPQIDRARKAMEQGAEGAPYWVQCSLNPVACARKEQMETWRRDIDRGLRALVDSSQSLGDRLMDHDASAGVDAMTGWAQEWVPKMFGAHAIGEGAAVLQSLLQWIGDPLAPISDAIMSEVTDFVRQEFPQYYELYLALKDPATQMDNVGFPAGTRQEVDREMGLSAGRSTFDWRAFEPMYNSIVLSKLALLDGDGLNELARRAGLPGPLFPPGEATNVMLGVFRSMTQSFQWIGDTVRTDTGSTRSRFGICGPEEDKPLPAAALCGVAHSVPGARARPGSGQQGFVLWGDPIARDSIFRRVFKGYGPGPGSAMGNLAAIGPVSSAVREGARALRAAAEQTERMREIVAGMRGKTGGALTATAAARSGSAAAPPAPPAPAPARTSPRGRVAPRPAAAPAPPPAAPASVSDWGRRCCARDVDELRAAIAAIQAAVPRFQSPGIHGRLGRRNSIMQLGPILSQLAGSLDAFEATGDARAAGSALDAVAQHVDVLARVVAGTR